MPRTFVSPNGFTILAGKDRNENDMLTFEDAKPHHFWLHAAGVPGSHVIMKWDRHCESFEEPSEEDFQYAANVAAHFSKGKNENVVMVHVCRICDVTKPDGARKGQVECQSKIVLKAFPHKFISSV